MNTIRQGAIGAAILLATFAVAANAQDTLQFTAVRVTDEGAVHLEWASQSNEVYQVQCADALAGGPDGSTVWQTLYDNYPSHGTSTFWLDTGDYLDDPVILHPKKMPMRFYRILDEGADTASGEPVIAITSPAAGAAASGDLTVIVSAATDAYKYVIDTTGEPPVVFAVAGDANCRSDLLQTNYNPTGTWFYETNVVWTP